LRLSDLTNVARLDAEATRAAKPSATQFLDQPETVERARPALRMRAADFLDAVDVEQQSATAFLDAPAGPAAPSAEELSAAATPARMTLTRSGQPVLSDTSASQARAAPGAQPAGLGDPELERFYRETQLADRVFNPLVAGVKRLHQDVATMAAGVAARNLRDFDAMRRGDVAGGIARVVQQLTPEQFEHARQRRLDALDREVGRIIGLQTEVEQIPANPALTATARAKSLREALEHFWRDPGGVILAVGLQSLPASAPGLVAGTAGAALAGPVAGGALMGLGSFGAEYLNAVLEGLEERGIDVRNPEALKAAFLDPAIMADVRGKAATRGGIIGAFDALTFGIASKTLAPKALGPLAREVVNLPAQTGVQATGGALGESGAQLATEGEISKPGQVLLEAVGEGFTAPVDVAGMAVAGARRARRPAAAGGQVVGPGGPRDDAIPAVVDGERPARLSSGEFVIKAESTAKYGPELLAKVNDGTAIIIPADEQPGAPQPATAAQARAAEPGASSSAPAPAAQPAPPARARRGELSAGAFLDGLDERAQDPATQADMLDEGELARSLELEAEPEATQDAGSREQPAQALTAADVRAADAQVDLNPTPGQKDAENYRMGHLDWQGLDISIETPKGGTRTAKDGSWSVPDFPASYGRFKGTVGADGDHVDTFIGDHVESPRVFVIDQVDAEGGKFDEHKVMIGFRSRDEALAAYDAAFADGKGPARRGAVSALSVEELKRWLDRAGARKGPYNEAALERRSERLQVLAEASENGQLAAYTLEDARRQAAEERAVSGHAHSVVEHPTQAGRYAVLPEFFLATKAGEALARGARAAQASPAASEGAVLAVEPEGERQAVGASVAMTPGTNYAGFIDDAGKPASAAAQTGEPIRREAVLARFLKALGVPIYEGRVAGKRMGYYRPKLETVRMKRASDLETAAHELAHLIDDRVFNGFGSRKDAAKTRPWIVGPNARTFANELRGVSYDQTKVYEGWAEFVRLWMTQPERAAAAAPEFAKWFDDFVKKHEYGPAILQARHDMQAWFDQDALARARSKIGDKRDINEHLDSFWDRFRQATVDDLHGVYRMERELAGGVVPRAAYETARLTRAAHSIVDGTLRFGHIVRNPDGAYAFKGKGLEQILKPVSDRLEEFLMYAVGRSARELRAQGREHLFTLGEIRAMLALERPEFDQAFKDYQQWNRAILDFAEAHGVINAEARRHWRRAEYLPFHRVGTGEPQRRAGGAEGNWSGIKKLTGGTDNIRDVLGNLIGNAAMLIDVALKNEARQRIAELGLLRGGGRFLERIPPESRKVKIDRDQVREKLVEAASATGQADVERTIDEILAGAPYLMDFLVRSQTPTGGNIMAVLRDGKPTYYEVVDPILYRAVAALNRPAQPQIVRWLSIPKRVGQASITLTPDFAVANLARDTVMGAIMSRSGFLPAIDSIRGLTTRLTSDPAYAEYIANGGGYASYFVDEAAFRNHLARFYSSKGINPRTVIDAPGKLIYFLETLFDSFELSTRLGEYKRLRAQGEHPRHAAYLGREISTDFAMRGDSRTLGFFYDTVMFLRPAAVSMDRLFRGVAHDPNRGAIAAKAATLALLSAALYLVNRDNDDYRDLEDWDRDNYWHFFIPKPDGGHLHFRYPKIWEVGALATLAERTVERVMDGQPKEYAKDFARVVKQAFNLNFMPQALAPLAEQATNRDGFTGRPIQPRGLEELQPYLRATPGTSETMRQLGQATKGLPEALQVNPVRAEALLTGYLNTWAMYGLMLSDAALFPGKLPERRLDQYPVLRRFFRQEPPLHTKHERTFYELLDESRRLRATMRELDRRGEDRDVDELEAEVLGRASYLDRVRRDLAENRREAERVRRSDVSPAEKRREIDRLTAERNALFRETVREVEAEKAAARAREAPSPAPTSMPAGGAPRAQDAASARLRAIRRGISDEARP
jgi:hypothetical protein